jgi:phage replication-related protein YjqB (UPF0714/DUF867 family)
MDFSLVHPDKVRTWMDRQDCFNSLPSDTGSIEYKILFSGKANAYVIARYHGGNLTGYAEKEDA